MTVMNGFELIEERTIQELNSRARLYRHVKTDAQLLSLENDDENKVFAITFRTPPVDSTGVAHILEHSVLAGSEKYPLKDPFREIAKGSLNTFLNAFTFPDKTCYPVASQNLQDFYNLIDVYVDSVFHPLIHPETLQQEGWRYELENPDAPLTFKGVVFNEMKGAYSSPDNVLDRFSQQSLFPNHTYGVDSGGDPKEIPNLTYEQFKDFHTRYYHPSNAYVYFYGDDDPQERLRLMDSYLQEFEPLKVDSTIGLHPGIEKPQELTIPYDAGQDGKRKAYLTVNWLLPDTLDPERTFTFNILNHILVGTPASPLRKALVDSGLGEDLAGGGLESQLRQMMFSTGLKGVAIEDLDRVETLIFETLQKLAQEGIDPDTTAASVNTIEFRLRENNTGAMPRGLIVMLRALTTWLYDGDPFNALAFEAPLSALKARLAAGEPVFEDLIRGSFLDNPHRTVLTLQPDTSVRQREEMEERERLERARAGMTPGDIQAIIDANKILKERQETPDSPEALATIPSLKLADLDRQIKPIPLEVVDLNGGQVLYHDLFTNGIVYLDLGFNLHTLPQEDLPYVSLFGRALLELGTETQDEVKLQQRIGRETGGIYPAPFTASIHDSPEASAWLLLRGKATTPQAGSLLAILRDVLLTARLDNRERFRQIVLEEKAGLEAQLAPMGHRVVNGRLRAQFGEAGWAAEQLGGIDFLFFLRRLVDQIEIDWPAVLDKLESLRSTLLQRRAVICNVTLDEEGWSRFHPGLSEFLAGLPDGAAGHQPWTLPGQPPNEGLEVPAKVNYVGKGANLYELGYRFDGSILVINNYLRNSWLYERVRLQGGAYGVFPVFDHRSGVFTFLSYRDPNLLNTLATYDETGQFLRSLDESRLDTEEITRNIIGAIGDLDAYQLPDAKGFTSMQRYLTGDTDERRQRLRDEVLSASPADFRVLGEVLDRVRESGRVVVLGSAEALETANASRQGFLEVKKVL